MNRQLSNKLFANLNLNFNNYSVFESDPLNKIQPTRSYNPEIYIRGCTARVLFDFYPSYNHTLNFGLESNYFDLKPEFEKRFSSQANNQQNSLRTKALGVNVFAEDKIEFNNAFNITAGIRVNSSLRKAYQFFSLQPRLTFSLLLKENLALKGSASKMNQFFHLMAFNNAISIVDNEMWIPSSDKLKPQTVYEGSIGIDWQLEKWGFSFNSYHKNFSSLVSQGQSFLSNVGLGNEPNKFENIFDLRSKGYGYGFEFSVNKKQGKMRGWINYTYSRSFRKILNSEFNQEGYHPYRFDRPHDLSVVFMQDFGKNITFSFSWFCSSGENITRSSRFYLPTDPLDTYPILTFEKVNNYRLSSAHRLDFSINFRKKKKHWVRIWAVNCYNAYRKKNVYQANIVVEENGRVSIEKRSLFDITPSIKYRMEF